MRTPDEIKKGLEHCIGGTTCRGCPYCEECAIASDCNPMHKDLQEYIRQLEAERDAAVADIKQMVLDPYEPCFCDYCKLTEEECARSNCKGRSAFVWRGVQKEE